MTEAMTPAASTSDVRAILLGARELIADPARWCRCTWARTESHTVVDPLSFTAVRWCASGALWRVSQSSSGTAFDRALEVATRAARAAGWDWLGEANDNLNHADVLAILDTALASLSESRHD